MGKKSIDSVASKTVKECLMVDKKQLIGKGKNNEIGGSTKALILESNPSLKALDKKATRVNRQELESVEGGLESMVEGDIGVECVGKGLLNLIQQFEDRSVAPSCTGDNRQEDVEGSGGVVGPTVPAPAGRAWSHVVGSPGVGYDQGADKQNKGANGQNKVGCAGEQGTAGGGTFMAGPTSPEETRLGWTEIEQERLTGGIQGTCLGTSAGVSSNNEGGDSKLGGSCWQSIVWLSVIH